MFLDLENLDPQKMCCQNSTKKDTVGPLKRPKKNAANDNVNFQFSGKPFFVDFVHFVQFCTWHKKQ